MRRATSGPSWRAAGRRRGTKSGASATPSPGATLPGALTEREIDVLRAIARGLSNAEVARELYVGETTVKTHVTSILGKLGVRDRLQAVIVAYESGLVRPGS